MKYENFSSRLTSELKHELQIYCAVNKISIQEALNESIKEWLEKNGEDNK